MRKMTKLVIVSPWEPWHIGGIERLVSNAAEHLMKDFDLEIYCTGHTTYKSTWNRIPISIFKGYTKGYRYSSQLAKALKKADFDIIHAHGFTTYAPYAAVKAKSNKKMIFNPHYHEFGSTLFYKFMRKVYDPTIGRHILKKADRIICVSNTEKSDLQSKFKIHDEKITIIPSGVDVEKMNIAEPFEFNGKLVLYVGRLEKYKNIHVTIQAMKYLPDDYRFHIIGNGPYRQGLENLIRDLSLENRVKILSNVSNGDVCRSMKTCSVFITLSNIEAFGLTVLEALASGRPVIVNNKANLAELARKFEGCVVPMNIDEISKEGLGKTIMRIADKRISANLDEYRWENIAKKYQRVYEE